MALSPSPAAQRRRRRLFVLLGGLAFLGVAVALTLTALRDNIVFFYSPSDIKERGVAAEQRVRIGGLVAEGSIEQSEGGRVTRFVVTDLKESVPVTYLGFLPDLFREGQGVVAQGTLGPDGIFVASEVLAKHDEQYMPPEVADALKRAGQWKHAGDAKAQ